MGTIIGVSGNIMIDEKGAFPGYKRSYVNNDYITSVIKAGGTPFIIPVNNDKESIKEQVKHVDGIILSGGQDPNPLLYREEPHQKLGEISIERDMYDLELIKIALELKKPLFGICRGHQVLNIYFGGSLYQDLSLVEGCYIKHNQERHPSIATHTVLIKEDSFLDKILGKEYIVNSFHHLVTKEIGKGFEVVATSKDGVCEAMIMNDPFIISTQWHPEMMTSNDEKMNKLFQYFINKCNSLKSSYDKA